MKNHECGTQDEYCAGCHEEEVQSLKLQLSAAQEALRAILETTLGGDTQSISIHSIARMGLKKSKDADA